MKRITHSVVALAMVSSLGFAGGDIEAVPVLVEADNGGVYIGAGLSAVSARGFDESADFFNVKYDQDRLGNITFLAGYDFNQYIGAEVRYTTSFSYEEIIEMNGWSIFVKPQYPVTEAFTIYGLLGYGGVNGSGINGIVIDADDNGFHWGVGLSYAVTENIDIFADYTDIGSGMETLINRSMYIDSDYDSITVGLNYHF